MAISQGWTSYFKGKILFVPYSVTLERNGGITFCLGSGSENALSLRRMTGDSLWNTVYDKADWAS